MGLVAFWFVRRGMGCENQRVQDGCWLECCAEMDEVHGGRKEGNATTVSYESLSWYSNPGWSGSWSRCDVWWLCVAVEARDQLGL